MANAATSDQQTIVRSLFPYANPTLLNCCIVVCISNELFRRSQYGSLHSHRSPDHTLERSTGKFRWRGHLPAGRMVFIGLSFQDLGERWRIFLVDKVNGNKRIHWSASYESGFALNRITNRCSEQSAFQWIGRVCQTQDFFSLCCDWCPGCCWLDGWRLLHLKFSTKNKSETTYLVLMLLYINERHPVSDDQGFTTLSL